MKKFVFTCGDVNGIGPEIVLKTLNKISSKNKRDQFILVIPNNIFQITSKLVKPKFKFDKISTTGALESKSSQVIILTTDSVKQTYGKSTTNSGRAAYNALKMSFNVLQSQLANAVVTAPVSKTALHLAGVRYPGQTEMFADWCGVKNFVMTFLSDKLRVGLYSIHIPLKEVSKSLILKRLQDKINIVFSMLKNDLGIINPRIAILGLNPHAGENGIIGTEEKVTIRPAVNNKFSQGIIEGPFSSDAFFAHKRYKEFDLVFGLYHDQVLIPFKFINSGKGVNYSAGLPIIRTSPDHGVAYDIAGKGIADESSMVKAFDYAKRILKNRKKKSYKHE